MKKIFFILICMLCCSFLTSCKKDSFDETDYDNIYVQIVLSTDQKINLQLFHDKAPITVENFISLVKKEFYVGTFFHRLVEGFVIQGGGYYFNENNEVTAKTKTDAITGEFTKNGWGYNNIKHRLGTISMARTSDYDSATTQFFLCVADCSSLNGYYAGFGYTTDDESDAIIVAISEMTTTTYGNLSNFPLIPVFIKKINLSNTQF